MRSFLSASRCILHSVFWLFQPGSVLASLDWCASKHNLPKLLAGMFCLVIVTVSSLSLPPVSQSCRRHDDHLSVWPLHWSESTFAFMMALAHEQSCLLPCTLCAFKMAQLGLSDVHHVLHQMTFISCVVATLCCVCTVNS